MLLLLCSLALAAPRPSDPVEAKLAWSLREALAADAAGTLDDWRFRLPEPVGADGLSVVVLPAGALEGADLREALEADGYDVEAASGGEVQVRVAWDELRILAGRGDVARVREPLRVSPKAVADEKVTEGYAAVMAQDWHEQGITGEGVTIGVADVGFHNAESLMGTELPDDVTFVLDHGEPEASSHGTAVAEILHDFAPDAALVLESFSTDVEFGEVMADLTDRGVDVINGSIGFDNVWHADGTSSLTIYADRAVDAGAIYLAAAGNEDGKYRIGALSGPDADTQVAIANRSGVLLTAANGYVDVSLRWSEPFGGASRDLDLVVYGDDGTPCGTSQNVQDGSETSWPYEHVSASGCADRVYAYVSAPLGTDVSGLTGYLYSAYGMDESYLTHTQSLTLPGDTIGGVTVGGWDADAGEVPTWSSRGPTDDGRLKPDVVAPTGVTTKTYGTGRFDGTSASTPHAAGLAALWVDASRRHQRPDLFKEWVLAEAVDGGDPGVDPVWGAGALHADELPARACGCASSGPANASGLAGVIGLAFVLRRRVARGRT